MKIKERVINYLASLSLLNCALIGFSISYIFLFLVPVFLNDDQVMRFFNYIPIIKPIGIDLKQTLGFSEAWFIEKRTPYIGFPPLAQLLFVPLLYLEFKNAYTAITIITVLCFILITYRLPLLINNQKQPTPLLMLIFLAGLFSYGLQFELERGQFNVIAVFLSLLAIYLFHYRHRYRYWAYLLFIVSVQLKLYPALFIFLMIKDWRDWKNNIKRFIGLALANFSLLFVLGYRTFFEYLNYVRNDMANPYIWAGNHSIRSFVTHWFTAAVEVFEKKNWVFYDYSGIVEIALLLISAGCILLVIFKAYRQNRNGIDPYLLLVCTIGTLIIPAQSHDYKLSVLVFAVAVFFAEDRLAGQFRFHLFFRLLTIVFFTAYSTTLFSYTTRPWFICNLFPALMAMLVITAVFSLLPELSRPDTILKNGGDHCEHSGC